MDRTLAFALLSTLLLTGGARAESVVEPSTGRSFASSRSFEGRPYELVGVGVRKKFVVKVYAMALYADGAEARRAFPQLVARAGGKEHDKLVAGSEAQAFVVGGSFGKVGVLQFARDVDAGKIRAAYEEGLEAELADGASPELRKAAQDFVAAFDRDVKEGQEILLRTGDKIAVDLAGQRKEFPGNAKLARAIWSIWLGQKPISKDLRTALVDRIDVLGR